MIMKRVLLNCILGLTSGLMAFSQQPASAHPMGNFSISHYAKIAAANGDIKLHYMLDFAEIPTVSEMDSNGDGRVTSIERENYLHIHMDSLRKGLVLSMNGELLPLEMENAHISARPGAGGLDTVLIIIDFHASTGYKLLNVGTKLEYRDNNFADRTGWKEIVMAGSAGGSWSSTQASAQDRSHGLSRYPAKAASAPPQELSAELEFHPGVFEVNNGESVQAQQVRPNSPRTPQDAFTRSIATKKLTPGIILISLLFAALFGAMHALSPGHGKAMVAAYLVGARGTGKHAIFLGGVITITHTIGVFALGLITLALSRYIVPEHLYPYLSAFSGMSIVIIGATLFRQRLKHMLSLSSSSAGHDYHHHHEMDHHHSDHDQSHLNVHEHGHSNDHVHSSDHHHDHSHVHEHHYENTHEHDHTQLEMEGYHHHGDGIYHSHTLPEDTSISLKSLLVLGITGGVVPCPSALVVMLSAIALHRTILGLALITAFSLGLAVVLSGIGILVVYARGFMQKLPSSLRLTTRLPVFSAAVVTIIGLVLVINSIRGVS